MYHAVDAIVNAAEEGELLREKQYRDAVEAMRTGQHTMADEMFL